MPFLPFLFWSSQLIAPIVSDDSSTFEKSPTIRGALALQELIRHQEDDIQARIQTISLQASQIAALMNKVEELREERDRARTQLERLKRGLMIG